MTVKQFEDMFPEHEAERAVFLAALPNRRLRDIVRARMDGLTWAKAAERVYGYPCGDRARMKVSRYLAGR